jgi:hypothetical protein
MNDIVWYCVDINYHDDQSHHNTTHHVNQFIMLH